MRFSSSKRIKWDTAGPATGFGIFRILLRVLYIIIYWRKKIKNKIIQKPSVYTQILIFNVVKWYCA